MPRFIDISGAAPIDAAADARDAIAASGRILFDVSDYGAVGDGVADDTQAITDAISAATAAGGGVVHLGFNHLVSSTITVPESVVLRGHGGHGTTPGTTLTSSALSGPVILINNRVVTVERMLITSTSSRRAATATDGHGVFITGGDTAGTYPSMSRINLFDLDIRDQPTDGVHCIGAVELSCFDLITVIDCVRHGYVLDGGLVAGYTNTQQPPFEMELRRCRAYECGGQALITLSTGGRAPHGMLLHKFEALGCAWDSSQVRQISGYAGSEDYQVHLGGRAVIVDHIDVEDQQYANATTTVGGHARTALATPAKGVYCVASGVRVNAPFFSSLLHSWQAATALSGLSIEWPTFAVGNYGVEQSPAITVPSNFTSFHLRYTTSMTAGATTVVQNSSTSATIEADGVLKRGLSLSTVDWAENMIPVDVTISSGTLTTTSRKTIVSGEGAAADSLARIRPLLGTDAIAGLDIYLIRGDEDITILHASNNILTQSGSNITMSATANQVVHLLCDGTNWIQVA